MEISIDWSLAGEDILKMLMQYVDDYEKQERKMQLINNVFSLGRVLFRFSSLYNDYGGKWSCRKYNDNAVNDIVSETIHIFPQNKNFSTITILNEHYDEIEFQLSNQYCACCGDILINRDYIEVCKSCLYFRGHHRGNHPSHMVLDTYLQNGKIHDIDFGYG